MLFNRPKIHVRSLKFKPRMPTNLAQVKAVIAPAIAAVIKRNRQSHNPQVAIATVRRIGKAAMAANMNPKKSPCNPLPRKPTKNPKQAPAIAVPSHA